MSTNKVPRTFCVTLKETPLRTEGFRESSNLAGIDAEFFYGVLGSKMGLATKLPNIMEFPSGDVFMTEGAIGCMLSHYMLWKTLSYQPEDEFFVCEDDALFIDGFQEKFQNLYSRLPSDWEMVYVGWITYGRDISPITVDDGISIRIPSATHAYLVKKSVLEKLCSASLPLQCPLDLTLIHKFLPTARYYVFDPPLIGQKSYLNTQDSTWTSIVYDWKTDLYGSKKKMLKDFELLEGWHNSERTDSQVWRWSKDEFKLKIPKTIDSITFLFSSPIENTLLLQTETYQQEFPVSLGENQVVMPVKMSECLKGKLTLPYIPAHHSGNNDTRVLGLCLKRLILKMGNVEIPLEISDVGSLPHPPINFRL